MNDPTKKKRSLMPLAYMFIIFGAAVALFPFIWMVLSGFKPSAEILQPPPTFFPKSFYLGGFKKVLFTDEVPFFRWLFNSIVVSSSATAISVFTSALAGYIYAKFSFFGKKLSFFAILATLMVPFEVILIPVYLIVQRIGLLNSLGALIVPAMVTAFGVFLCKQFCEAIPTELIECGRCDGSSEFGIFFKIIIPEIRPALSALVIMEFMASWNNYMWPLIAINDMDKMTVPLALTIFNSTRIADVGATMAAATLIIIPVIVVYLIFQRQFIEGLQLTGMK